MVDQLCIAYRIGDATAPVGAGPRVVTHICNDVGGWGAGFVLALSNRWPDPEAAYKRWFEGREQNDFELGAVQMVQVEDDIWVANIVGQRGITPSADGPPICYPAVESGLSFVAERAQEMAASVHMPRMGVGLGGGDWVTVETIVDATLIAEGIEVTVYDLP